MGGKRLGARRSAHVGIGVLCLAVLVVGAQPGRYQQGKGGAGEGSAKKLLVSRMKQPGSPLTISQVIVDDSKDPLMPTIHCNMKNNSSMDIIAYSVKHEAVFIQRTGTFSGSITFDQPDAENGMRPGETQQVELNG